ncbi:MAG TPA: hypothetical protein VNO79_12160, partial [Actinomycetota bacterium]|nr:hypothetical protein [Actinomycetota bacterium]
MGERTILVCDVCGEPATETVSIRVGRRNLVKDLCAAHVAEIVRGARRPRPGRRKGTVAKPEAARKTAAKRSASSTGRRRGRPSAAAAG